MARISMMSSSNICLVGLGGVGGQLQETVCVKRLVASSLRSVRSGWLFVQRNFGTGWCLASTPAKVSAP